MKHLALLLLCLGLAGCATPAPPPAAASALFRDAAFAAPAQPIDADAVFALSPAMQHYLDFELARPLRTAGPQRGLLEALYRRDQLRLEYDAAVTRNAGEAFEARRGNCLSLVIMTAAFAKAMNLRVSYQLVATDEVWTRSNDIAFLSRHVNLTLAPSALSAGRGHAAAPALTVDFLPSERLAGQRARPVSEDTIVAMYLNNRAAEALAADRVDQAYWWARAAIVRAPDFASAYNTLGVVYLRHGDPAAAEQVLRQLLERDPRDRHALANQATALQRLGRDGDAAVLRERLARLETHPPFHFLALGQAALARGDFASARDGFAREVARDGHSSEPHFWLGVAHLKLGQTEAARQQFAIALELSTTGAERELYGAKLDSLRATGVR